MSTTPYEVSFHITSSPDEFATWLQSLVAESADQPLPVKGGFLYVLMPLRTAKLGNKTLLTISTEFRDASGSINSAKPSLTFSVIPVGEHGLDVQMRVLEDSVLSSDFSEHLISSLSARWPDDTERDSVFAFNFMSHAKLNASNGLQRAHGETLFMPSEVNGGDIASPATDDRKVLYQTEPSLEDRKQAKKLSVRAGRFVEWKKIRYLHHHELLTYEEIARRLSVTKSKVKTDMSDMKKVGFYDPKAT